MESDCTSGIFLYSFRRSMREESLVIDPDIWQLSSRLPQNFSQKRKIIGEYCTILSLVFNNDRLKSNISNGAREKGTRYKVFVELGLELIRDLSGFCKSLAVFFLVQGTSVHHLLNFLLEFFIPYGEFASITTLIPSF